MSNPPVQSPAFHGQDVGRRDEMSGDKLEMKLGELKLEIEQSAKSPYGEKLYPITSDWIPVTNVLAIVDRFERELRGQFDSVLATAKSQSKKEIEELLLRIVADLLA